MTCHTDSIFIGNLYKSFQIIKEKITNEKKILLAKSSLCHYLSNLSFINITHISDKIVSNYLLFKENLSRKILKKLLAIYKKIKHQNKKRKFFCIWKYKTKLSEYNFKNDTKFTISRNKTILKKSNINNNSNNISSKKRCISDDFGVFNKKNNLLNSKVLKDNKLSYSYDLFLERQNKLLNKRMENKKKILKNEEYDNKFIYTFIPKINTNKDLKYFNNKNKWLSETIYENSYLLKSSSSRELNIKKYKNNSKKIAGISLKNCMLNKMKYLNKRSKNNFNKNLSNSNSNSSTVIKSYKSSNHKINNNNSNINASLNEIYKYCFQNNDKKNNISNKTNNTILFFDFEKNHKDFI